MHELTIVKRHELEDVAGCNRFFKEIGKYRPAAAFRPAPSSGLRAIIRRLAQTFLLLAFGPIAAYAVPITFEFEGEIGMTCFECTDGSEEFGSGIPPGTSLRGRFTFDSNTPPTPTLQTTRVDYIGVSVEFMVGSEIVSGNDTSKARIQIGNGPPQGDSYSLLASDFSSGTIAGQTIDEFTWVVSAPPSLFWDQSLPLDPSFLTPLLDSRVCLGDCFSGEALEGRITSLRLVPCPSTVGLFASSLSLLGWLLRRRRC